VAINKKILKSLDSFSKTHSFCKHSKISIVRSCGNYFYKAESPEVWIYSHFGWFGFVKIGPTCTAMGTESNKNVIMDQNMNSMNQDFKKSEFEQTRLDSTVFYEMNMVTKYIKYSKLWQGFCKMWNRIHATVKALIQP